VRKRSDVAKPAVAPPPAPPRPKPRVRGFTDLTAALATVAAERDWRFVGAIEGAPIAVLAGPEKSSKSWALMQAAVACATGGKRGQQMVARDSRILR
jgi:hypothetical protein